MEPVKIDGNNLLSQIEKMAKELGIEGAKEVTVVRLRDGEEPNKKSLELIQGSWDSASPWFVIDDKDRVFVLSSLESILSLLKSLNDARYENFNLKLEKAILENMPVDFNDVWVVAMSEIQKRVAEAKDKNVLDIDIKRLISDIKKHHPNLFLNLKNFSFPEGKR